MSNTKYYTKINDIILDKVRSLTVEKNLSQYSGKFSLSVSDPDNLYYNEFTSGDEIQVIENYVESTIEREQSYATANAVNWYKFNNDLVDSVGGINGALSSTTTGVTTTVTYDVGRIDKCLKFPGNVLSINYLSGSDVLSFGKSTDNQQVAQSFVCPADSNGVIQLIGFRRSSNIGTLSDNTSIRIFADSGGSPGGSAIISFSYSATNWNQWGTTTDVFIRTTGITGLTPGNTYWIVFNRASLSDTNYARIIYDSTGTSGVLKVYDGSNWNTINGTIRCAIGYTDYVMLPSKIELPYNNFSVFWRMKTTSTAYECLFSNNINSGSGQIEITNGATGIRYESTTNNVYNPTTFTTGDVVISDGEWHDYCLVSSATSFKLYVDGIETSSKTPNTDTVTQKFQYFGAFQSAPNGTYGLGFSGNLDDVRFYDKALSIDELQEIRWNLAETKVFGGFLENVKRNKDNKYILDIDGGDYTTKFNNIIVLAEVYNGREYSVIIRDLVNKYVMNTSIIDNCDVATGWNSTNGTLTLETGIDSNGYLISRLGEACLKIVPTGTDVSIYKIMDFGYNYLNTDYVGLYLFVEDSNKINVLTLKIGQDDSNYYITNNTINELQNGWNYVEFDLSTATIVGSPSLDNIIYFEININLDDTTNTIYIDDLRKIAHGVNDYTVSNVEITPYYTDIKFKNVSLYDAIRKVKEIRPNTYDFYVDINKILNFGYFGEISSGQLLERGKNVLKSEFWDDDTKLCNKVTVYAAKQEFGYSEIFSGNNTTKEFVLEYQPISQEVYISGVLKKGYVSGMSPTDYDYRVDYENRTIIFNTAPPSAANNVKIDYRYGVPIIVQRSDETSVNNYGLREQKIENEYLLTKQDAITVAQEYIDSWKNPILNAKYSIRVNPMIDIGETVGVIDYRYFEDNNVRHFGVVSVKHTFVGAKMQTELNLTLITKSVEMYLQDIFSRLNALEEKDKGDKDVLNRLLYFSDTYEILDDPSTNLGIYSRDINDSFILGHPTNSIIGVTLLGDRTGVYSSNLVVNPSD